MGDDIVYMDGLYFLSSHGIYPFYLSPKPGVLGIVSFGFLLFTLATSNPFTRQFHPDRWRRSQPLLQDPGLIIHPPMLYVGYVGFSIAFSLAVASLMEAKQQNDWARWARPWTLQRGRSLLWE